MKKVFEDVTPLSLRWTRIQEPRTAVLEIERKKLIATQSWQKELVSQTT